MIYRLPKREEPPNDGQVRTVKKFAWLPTKVIAENEAYNHNECIIWLHEYEEDQCWRFSWDGMCYFWDTKVKYITIPGEPNL